MTRVIGTLTYRSPDILELEVAPANMDAREAWRRFPQFLQHLLGGAKDIVLDRTVQGSYGSQGLHGNLGMAFGQKIPTRAAQQGASMLSTVRSRKHLEGGGFRHIEVAVVLHGFFVLHVQGLWSDKD